MEFDDGSAMGRYFAAFAPRSVGGLTFTPRDTIDSEEKHLPRWVTFVLLYSQCRLNFIVSPSSRVYKPW